MDRDSCCVHMDRLLTLSGLQNLEGSISGWRSQEVFTVQW